MQFSGFSVPAKVGVVLVGCAALAAVWTALASFIFLAGSGLIYAFPRPFWQWWLYLPYHHDPVVHRWLMIGGLVPAGFFGLLGVIRLRVAPRGPSVRPPLFGPRPQPVMRGITDNHGHAEWMPLATAKLILRPRKTEWGGLVIGEAARVDQQRIADVEFDPTDRRTWGRGGKSPLLIDPCIAGPTHSLIFAGSGGMKTSTAITRLLYWTGSAIVLDPSNEIGPMIQDARAAMGQPVVTLDLLGGIDPITGLAKAGFNPLAEIKADSPFATWRLLSAVASLCGEEPERDKNSIFSDAGRNLVTCVLGHMIWDDDLPAENKTLAFFREIITTPEAQMKDLLRGIAAMTRCTTARLAAQTLMELADETFSGAYFNATTYVAWLNDDMVVEFLSGSRVTATDIVKNRVTVFLHVPLGVLRTSPGVARIVLDALAWAFIEADGDYTSRTLLLVDEASKLGRMVSFELVRDTGRKYGLTMQLLYLSEAELAEVWGPKGPARWFATVSWRGYGAISDRDTAEGLSKDFGELGVLASSAGDNFGSSGKGFEVGSRSKGKSTSVHEVKRRLILPSELTEARRDELFVVRQGSKPIRCTQAAYFRRRDLNKRVKQNRFVKTATK